MLFFRLLWLLAWTSSAVGTSAPTPTAPLTDLLTRTVGFAGAGKFTLVELTPLEAAAIIDEQQGGSDGDVETVIVSDGDAGMIKVAGSSNNAIAYGRFPAVKQHHCEEGVMHHTHIPTRTPTHAHTRTTTRTYRPWHVLPRGVQRVLDLGEDGGDGRCQSLRQR
jgi:hypothetical protein